MIIEYHRPETVEEALKLLARTDPVTVPLAGGTVLARHARAIHEPLSVVDLQHLPIHDIEQEGQLLLVGAAVTLQQLYECEQTPEMLRESLRLETGLNQRQMASVAGTIISSDGRSPFVTALLALDPRLAWMQPGDSAAAPETPEALGDYLAMRPATGFQAMRRLMTVIRIPLNANLRLESVARSPLDRPIVCVAAAQWPSGRTRLALGGHGKAPILAMDGPEPGGIQIAARSAYRGAGDAWASAQYRSEIAGKLAERLASQLEKRMP